MNVVINCIELDLIPGPRYKASTERFDKNRSFHSVMITNADTGQHVKNIGPLSYSEADLFVLEFNKLAFLFNR